MTRKKNINGKKSKGRLTMMKSTAFTFNNSLIVLNCSGFPFWKKKTGKCRWSWFCCVNRRVWGRCLPVYASVVFFFFLLWNLSKVPGILSLSLTFSPSLLHSIFCMQGHQTPHDALRQGRETRSEESTGWEGEPTGGGRLRNYWPVCRSASLIQSTVEGKWAGGFLGNHPLLLLRLLTPAHLQRGRHREAQAVN